MRRMTHRPIDVSQTTRPPATTWNEDEVLDQVLRLVADHHLTLGQSIGRRIFSPSIAELRQSPLGRDLRLLTAAPSGGADPKAIAAAAEHVRAVLLRPLAADTYTVPTWFWGSDLGRIVARAERTAAGAAAFVSVAQAAAGLGMATSDLTAWIDDGSLSWVPDEAGQPLLRRSAVDRLRLVAVAMARPPAVAESEVQDVVIDERLSA